MWPWIILAMGLWGVSKLVSSRAGKFRGGHPAMGLLPGPSAASPQSSAPSAQPGQSIAMNMQVGHYYAFAIISPMSQTDIMGALHEVGAFVQGPMTPVPGVQNSWAGVFEWSGEQGEATENLPGITWTSLTDVSPGAAVS